MKEISSIQKKCFDLFKIVPYTLDSPMNLFNLVSKKQ